MRVFTNYFRFEHITKKAQWRIDCTQSTGKHPFFEERRKNRPQRETAFRDAFPIGALIMSYSKTDRIKAKGKRKAEYCLSFGKDSFTSIYPYGDNGFSYGDIRYTNDVVIFRDTLQITTDGIAGGTLEMWIARGMFKEENNLLQMVEDGLFDDELERLREQATAEPKAEKEPTLILSDVELPNQ